MYYWISWHQPTEDHRPMTYPPNKSVLGWWCTGYDSNDVATLCAVVRADAEDEAKSAVLTDWPEAERWRFCEQMEAAMPKGDRFRPTDWMVPRFAAAGA